jgi:hypothetical protein
VDPTAVVTAAIAGASGVGAGYLGMRQQTKIMRAQLDDERVRDRRTANSERHDCSTIERSLLANCSTSSGACAVWWLKARSPRMSTPPGGLSSGPFSILWLLTGTEPVRLGAAQLRALYGRVEDDRVQSHAAFAKALNHAFKRHEPELERARDHLIAVMRQDVAPDRAPDGAHGQAPLSTEAVSTHAAKLARRGGAVERAELAVFSTSDSVSDISLRHVTDAIQKQIDRDFAPRWSLTAGLTVYATEHQAPPGSWPVVIADDIDAGGMPSFHSFRDLASDGEVVPGLVEL